MLSQRLSRSVGHVQPRIEPFSCWRHEAAVLFHGRGTDDALQNEAFIPLHELETEGKLRALHPLRGATEFHRELLEAGISDSFVDCNHGSSKALR